MRALGLVILAYARKMGSLGGGRGLLLLVVGRSAAFPGMSSARRGFVQQTLWIGGAWGPNREWALWWTPS